MPPPGCTELDVSAFAWRKDSQGYAMYTRTNGFRWYNVSGSGENSTCVFVPTDTSELSNSTCGSFPTDASELSQPSEWQVNGLHFNSDGSVVALRLIKALDSPNANGIYFVKFGFDETGGVGKVLLACIPALAGGFFSSADWGSDGQGNPDGRWVTSSPFSNSYGVVFWRLKSDYSAVGMGKIKSYKYPVKQVALMSGAGAIVLPQNAPSNTQTGLCSVESLTPCDSGCGGVASQEGT